MIDKKSYKELRNETELEDGSYDSLLDELCLVCEGSGVITNTISMSLVSKVRRIGTRIQRSRDPKEIGKLLSKQNSIMVGLILISIVVSGSKEGFFNKSSKLLSIVKSMGTK